MNKITNFIAIIVLIISFQLNSVNAMWMMWNSNYIMDDNVWMMWKSDNNIWMMLNWNTNSINPIIKNRVDILVKKLF